MLEELQQRTQNKKVLILGIGNRLRGDDAVGSILAERLAKKLDVPIIDEGNVPENYLAPIETSGDGLDRAYSDAKRPWKNRSFSGSYTNFSPRMLSRRSHTRMMPSATARMWSFV